MSIPTTREAFRKYGLGKLGQPVIQVNVAKVQQETLIDDALQYFHEYAFEGLVRVFIPHQLSQDDLDNGFIELPNFILSVIRVFPLNSGASKNPLNFPINFTLADIRFSLNTFSGFGALGGFDLQNFIISSQYVQMVNDLLAGEREYEFNCLQGRLTIHAPLDVLMKLDDFIMVEAYQTVDPDDFPRVWNHMFLKKYFVALLKKQWGENLKKFGGMQLPGGVELNGKEIYDEAVEELIALEEDANLKWSEPPHFFTG